MASDVKSKKEKAIKREVLRLKKIYGQIEERRQETIEGLIQRAAFMRVTLEELEDDINSFGVTEWFSQGNQEPYQRERPTARVYNSLNTSYQKITKQLTDLLPKEALHQKDDGDAFDDF